MTEDQEELEELQLELQLLASDLSQDDPIIDEERIADALRALDALGVSSAMTPHESTRVALDNLPAMLGDRPGVDALRDGLALAARLIDSISQIEVGDWWGDTQPDVLVACDAKLPGAELFYAFGGRLIRELSESRNILAVPAPDFEVVDPDADWPPVHAVVTNHAGFRDWTFGWGGQLIWWQDEPSGFRVEQRTALGPELTEHFRPDQVNAAVTLVEEWVAEPPAVSSGDYLTVTEHRAIEVVVTAAREAIDGPGLTAEESLQIRVLTDTLLLQIRAPEPDRTIVGRALHGIGKFAAGAVVGVAATYLQALLVKFGVPPP